MNHYRAQRNTEPLMIHFVICFISIDVVKGREDNDYHFSLVVVWLFLCFSTFDSLCSLVSGKFDSN